MDELLVLRLGLLALLLGFVAFVALSMRSALAASPRQAGSRSATQPPRPRLAVMVPAASGLAPGASFELAGGMTIGRDPGNGIVVPDPSVSGEHAVIRLQGRTWILRDLGSTNGTLLDDEPVGGAGRPLRGGERVVVGAVVFRFQA